MKCIHCGNEIQQGSKFCRFCGKPQPAPAPNFVPPAPAYPPVTPNPAYPPVTPNPAPGYVPAAPNQAPGYMPVAPNPTPGYVPPAPNFAPGYTPVSPNGEAPAPQKKSGFPWKIVLPIAGGVLLLAIVGVVLFFVLGNGGSEVEELNGMTPEELYAHTQELMSEATSFSAETTQEIVIQSGASKMTMNQFVVSKQNGYDLYVKSENDMGAGEMEITYVDGMYYENSNGQKIKTPISVDDMERYYSDLYGTDGSYSTALLSIPGEWLEDLNFVRDGDSYTVTVIVPAEEYTELVGKMGMLDAEFTEDVEYVIYFSEDGELEKAITTFDFDVMGYSAHCESVSIFKFGDVTITPPADADTYTYYG